MPRTVDFVPLSDQRILLGRLHAHGEVEKGLRRRKPVRLLVRPGVLVLDVEVERTIRSRPIGPNTALQMTRG